MMHWELISWSVQMLKKVENMLVRNSWKNWDALAGKRGSGEESKPATVIWMAMLCYAKSLQSCPTLCNPIDSSPPGFPVPGILQARTLEWVAISFSNTWKWKVKVKLLSRVRLLATPWTAAFQAPPSMGFSRHWMAIVNRKTCPMCSQKNKGQIDPSCRKGDFVYYKMSLLRNSAH